jgi:hypothetical protein
LQATGPRTVKKPSTILVGLILALATGVVAISVLSARPSVSMALSEYTRWPHGATVRLTNGSRRTIRYLAERNDTPSGSPVLWLQKTASGWTNSTTTVVESSVLFYPNTSKTTEVFFLADPAVPPKPGDHRESLLAHDLESGRSAEFFIRLEPDARPIRVGTVYVVQHGQFGRMLQLWLSRIKQWCRIKTTVPGQNEVWCPEPLCLPSSPQPATRY